MRERRVPDWISVPLVVGAFGLLAWAERRRALRRAVESKPRREGRNLALAAVGALAVRWTERPVVERLTVMVEQRGWGLLKRVRLPVWMEVALAVVLLDYTLYVWHVLTHRVPFLWRFHVVHHVDLDLDASTAVRFHFAELVISVPWRAAQVLALGVSPLSFSVWQLFLFLSIMFHHSNVGLPIGIERRLNRIIVTPRMHGIHHSIVREETNSNWSSGFVLWDWLHGTLLLNVPQDEIDIGVAAYREPREIELPKILSLPFREERATTWWLLPEDGQPARRAPLRGSPEQLSA